MRYKLNSIKWLALALAGSFALGCSTTQYRERADKEVYAILEQKSPDVPGLPADFTIEQDTSNPLEGMEAKGEAADFLGEAAQTEVGAQVLTLEDCLRIAVTHSRTYQNQKELLYLQALSLTLDRHQFTPIFAASGSAQYNRSTTDIQKLNELGQVTSQIPGIIDQTGGISSQILSNAPIASGLLQELGVPGNSDAIAALAAVGALAGTPAQLLGDYANIVEEAFTVSGINQPRNEIRNDRDATGDANLGVNLLMKGGARIAIGITTNFLRFITGDPTTQSSSALIASITQPLLRGRGRDVNAEFLTQAERDVLYQLRSYQRFRQEFAVQVATGYYNVLRARDAVRNNYQGYLAFQRSAEREQALADEGRTTQVALGRIQQSLLNAENSWVDAVRNYKQALDQYKILLGLSTDASVILDDAELAALSERGLIHPTILAEDAVSVALAARLDLYNTRDEKDDSERRIKVAANALKPDLDLVIAANVNNVPGENNFDELDFQRARWSAGFDVDLGLDRKSERNAYRSALIAFDRSIRELSLAEDNVKLDVRESWRNLDQAERNYENRKLALDLAARRVEEQNLRAEIGNAIALDQVDAQNDFINAQNELTDAIVRHTVARLEFWRDMGILYIKENGQWEEVNDVATGPQ
ncbi:MAG TPA: TolC family protein [Candidatus Hydrogenedentes bacterium]|nr:TolC family protein [Candidatus Hydrogenedentota bacterium]HRK33981.1 TolC family protein [Candidatus Hydrogenedentota bacterium]